MDEQPTWRARLTTPEEEAAIGNVIDRLNKFSSGELRACPICDKPLDKLYCWHGIENRVLYCRPCNCRLGCWDDAPAWAREAGIVEDDKAFLEEAGREPTCEELREDYPDEDWSDCEDNPIDTTFQEANGQKRLPGLFEEHGTDD